MNAATTPERNALVVGGTGISGSALSRELVVQGWQTTSLSRSQLPLQEGAATVRADLTDPLSVHAALAGLNPTHVSSRRGAACRPKRRTSLSMPPWSAKFWILPRRLGTWSMSH
ncbi:NAD-dependent epimerase/dehydratase family protein [Paenarthrobacter sp. Z7-10]|uniref:NAD-dependent epimerase/dehydratase family protein n=1 Tax=Paenarthrobacter sp. Z7-10 TaxID=2787635 RepID=UPI0022A9F666|nr:NAD-dependent epimerase/dehydratase family protein [Paenarthrobacter sp. Z7-10]